MFSWWKKGDGAIRLTDDDLFFNEKVIFDDKHVLFDEKPLSDPDDVIRQNLEVLGLIDPVVAENLFLTAKKQQGAICLEDQAVRPSSETTWRIITRILISNTPISLFSLLLHVAAIALALAGRWYLYQALLNLEEHKDEGEVNIYTNRCGGAFCEWHTISWKENLYNQFWDNRTANVLSVLVVPIVGSSVHLLLRVFGTSVAGILSSVYEIAMIVLLIYFPTVSVSQDGFKWEEVLVFFGHGVSERTTEEWQLKLGAFLCVYAIALIYLILVSVRIISEVITLSHGQNSSGRLGKWLYSKGYNTAIGLNLISIPFSIIGIGMMIWNLDWWSSFNLSWEVWRVWICSGFPLLLIVLFFPSLWFISVVVVACFEDDHISAKGHRIYSIVMASTCVPLLFTTSIGLILMDRAALISTPWINDGHLSWELETTKPRSIVAIAMTGLVGFIHLGIILAPKFKAVKGKAQIEMAL